MEPARDCLEQKLDRLSLSQRAASAGCDYNPRVSEEHQHRGGRVASREIPRLGKTLTSSSGARQDEPGEPRSWDPLAPRLTCRG